MERKKEHSTDKAQLINTLGAFCGQRDILNLTQKSLKNQYGIQKADVFVLFGGSILEGGNVLAEAIRTQVADTYIIVGGVGHTTETLREIARQNCGEIETEALTEAELFHLYVKKKYGLQADYLECSSTNCGNNITRLLGLIQKNHIKCNSIILSQDATMQRRMSATLKKYVSDKLLIINYAVYQAHVIEKNGELIYREHPLGMWDMDRYITLLMGEIPRLRNDQNGYGPQGKNFISHVNIPQDVECAFEMLKHAYADYVREADSRYASE